MSTFTDGAPPSVSPEPGDDPDSDRGREPGPTDADSGAWLQEEIRRRMAARAATGGGARHARRGAPAPFPGTMQTSGHQPRHATPPAGAPATGVPGPGEPVQPARVLPSRARRFDQQPAPQQPADPPAAVAQPAAPPAPATPDPRATPSPAPRTAERPAFGGPALLHPALGGQAPDQAYGGPVRPRPGFGDAALLGGVVVPPTRPVAVPTPPPTPPQGAPAAAATDTGGRAAGTLPPGVAFRAGAAAARATTPPGHQSPGAGETGPAPVVDPVPTDDAPLPPNGRPTGPNPAVGNLRRVDPPAAAAKPVGAGLPAIGSNPVRVSRRPAPPAGPAAARLLSPPPSPPSTPTGIPIDGGPSRTPSVPLPVTASDVAAPDLAVADVAAPDVAAPDVDVPAQRAAGETPTTDLPTTEPATSPRRYLDYEDYDDDYEDPELDAEIAEAAQREAAAADEPDAEAIKRVRVVLAERKSIARPVRTVVDVQEGTGVGEILRRGLIRSQLKVAVSFAAAAMLGLAALPLLFAYLPALGRVSVLGIRLPWLVLGGLVYPFLLGLGWWHARTAEKVEKGFADHVQD